MHKKTLFSLAAVAGMTATSAVMADLTPYARIHLSVDSWDDAEKGYGTDAYGNLVNISFPRTRVGIHSLRTGYRFPRRTMGTRNRRS